MQCMEAQLTLRVPREVARALARRAQARGVARSQVVREALRAYLALELARAPRNVRERLERYRGSLRLETAGLVAPAPQEREERERAVSDALRVIGRLSQRDARALDEAVTALRARWR
ncbi:MAG: ribbon-helix-helix protein, CopG family [Gemmatimonadales bacterium]